MSVVIDGTSGITTPAETVTGNTILGDATTDTLTVGVTGIVKDASGNVGIGTASPTGKLSVAGNLTLEPGGSGPVASSRPQIWRGADGFLGIQSGGDTSGVIALYTGPSGTPAEQARIDSAGLFKFNSGYGSVATAYGCRAWVNFNGTASGTFAGGASTVTRIAASTTATITTATAHGLITGSTVYALTGVVAGTYTVTVLTTTTFTITTVATTVLTAVAITFAVNSIRASGNVSSITDNGTGDYTVNFTTAMSDANYSVSGNGSADFGVSGFASLALFTNSSAVETAPTTSAFKIITRSLNGVADLKYVCVSVFR